MAFFASRSASSFRIVLELFVCALTWEKSTINLSFPIVSLMLLIQSYETVSNTLKGDPGKSRDVPVGSQA